ncbi:ragulator complex protein LAMTOR5 homolog [Neodiprion pinetum]|uniref:Late endosomal/lysosomal adaptor and MAPK and MTOR activator 5 n=1 Tax=Neodiprion lecontei TaxID=441921 RepID=A0A6J0C9W7_NEOLC|nr:ragulator complex protein LAMTOR5 homolog [Neodiprion lecontei]XP_046422009.1 ragulator complex protein LAMTOR5 homolog [Neodiprion fabricii]XP_046490103.1 ragulator complex protein LAMTOR5 homolog [Neodiprion pinetum]XP_046609065.1 ragulator complex protein LAMTOR5 homolog [Neodiprion virginianus]
MERNLEKTMDNVTNVEGVIGCILADRQGLCLGAKGSASGQSAGLIAAIADEVAKLEPESNAPIIALESDNRQCIIQRQGPIVGAIYKAISP